MSYCFLIVGNRAARSLCDSPVCASYCWLSGDMNAVDRCGIAGGPIVDEFGDSAETAQLYTFSPQDVQLRRT